MKRRHEQEAEKYRRMTETPIPKLITTLGLPTIASMLITNIYNMADTYFVGVLGKSASGAIGVVFSLMAIFQAFGFTWVRVPAVLFPRASENTIRKLPPVMPPPASGWPSQPGC